MLPIAEPNVAQTSTIILIPWDPESKEHSERLYLQRIACGWRAGQIGKWQAKQREGKMNLHWIVSWNFLLVGGCAEIARLGIRTNLCPSKSTRRLSMVM